MQTQKKLLYAFVLHIFFLTLTFQQSPSNQFNYIFPPQLFHAFSSIKNSSASLVKTPILSDPNNPQSFKEALGALISVNNTNSSNNNASKIKPTTQKIFSLSLSNKSKSQNDLLLKNNNSIPSIITSNSSNKSSISLPLKDSKTITNNLTGTVNSTKPILNPSTNSSFTNSSLITSNETFNISDQIGDNQKPILIGNQTIPQQNPHIMIPDPMGNSTTSIGLNQTTKKALIIAGSTVAAVGGAALIGGAAYGIYKLSERHKRKKALAQAQSELPVKLKQRYIRIPSEDQNSNIGSFHNQQYHQFKFQPTIQSSPQRDTSDRFIQNHNQTHLLHLAPKMQTELIKQDRNYITHQKQNSKNEKHSNIQAVLPTNHRNKQKNKKKNSNTNSRNHEIKIIRPFDYHNKRSKHKSHSQQKKLLLNHQQQEHQQQNQHSFKKSPQNRLFYQIGNTHHLTKNQQQPLIANKQNGHLHFFLKHTNSHEPHLTFTQKQNRSSHNHNQLSSYARNAQIVAHFRNNQLIKANLRQQRKRNKKHKKHHKQKKIRFE